MKYRLETPYKGSRHYIQGGDLFNHIVVKIGSTQEYGTYYLKQLAFTRFTYHLCELVIDEMVESNMIIGKGVIRSVSGNKQIYLIETADFPSNRCEFDEASLVANAVYHANSISLNQKSGYTAIETVIALTKALTNKLMPLVNGKWVFGRIDLQSPLPDIKNTVKIEQKNAIQGRFSVNDIVIDGNLIGSIQFIVGNP